MSDKPRLLVLTSTFPRWRGDHEPPFVFELARRLTGFEVHVVAPHAPGAATAEIIDGVHVHRFRYAPERFERLAYEGGIPHRLRTNPWRTFLVPIFLLSQFVVALRLCRRLNCATIHAHWILPQGLLGVLVKRFAGHPVRLLVTIHGADLYVFRNPFTDSLRRWVHRQADAVTTVSQALRSDLLALVGDADKVHVAPMGVDLTSQFTPGQGIDSSQTIVFAGRLVAKKGVDVLLHAFAAIAPDFPNLRLLVAGHGPLEPSLRQLARHLAVEDCVDFLGRYQLGELPDIYRAASMAVFPFRHAANGDREGLGLVVVEAMGCGLPVIATDVPAMHDVVDHGDNGWLAPTGDPGALAEAIRGLLNDPSRAKRLGETGRRRALARFDWSAATGKYAPLLIPAPS